MRGIYKWYGSKQKLRQRLANMNGGWVCCWCKRPVKEYLTELERHKQPDQATIDHTKSRYYRKKGEVVLKVLACRRCNRLRAKAETKLIEKQKKKSYEYAD